MKKKYITIIFLLSILFLILGFSISQIYNNSQRINIPSMCYTNLQSPKNYVHFSSIDRNEVKIKFDLKEGQSLLFRTLANTGSMRPTLGDGGLVIILVNLEREDIKVGHIVFIDTGQKEIIHRVVEITSEGYVTKGDNNAGVDKDVRTFEQIKGKVVGVLY